MNSTKEKIIPNYPADFVNALWIFAAISQCVTLTFIAFYIHKRKNSIQYKPDTKAQQENQTLLKSLTSTVSPKTCSPTKPALAVLMMVAIFLYYGIQTPIFRIFPKMVFSYARDEACFSVDKSTTLQSTYFILMAAGRLTSMGLSPFLHSKYIMQVSNHGYEKPKV